MSNVTNEVSNSVTEVRRTPVTVTLGGEERTLKYDMNAFAEIENKYGSIDAAFSNLERGRLTDVRTLLWAGLIHDQAVIDETTGDVIKYNITPFQVGQWIENIGMLEGLSLKLSEALTKDMPSVPAAAVEAAENSSKN